MSHLRFYIYVLFNIPSTIIIMFIGVFKLLPMHKRGEVNIMERESLQEAIKGIADPMLKYRDHINWIFWILLALITFR